MRSTTQGATQALSAAKAGMSKRSARRIEQGRVRSERHWRTRADPFAARWESELGAMLQSQPKLSATTVLAY